MWDSISSSYCDRFDKNYRVTKYVRCDKVIRRPTLKKLVLSKTVPAEDRKSCSTCIINPSQRPAIAKPKKNTKSDINFGPQTVKPKLDLCKKCGDIRSESRITACSNKNECYLDSVNRISYKSVPKYPHKDEQRLVRQYYKNDLFQRSSESLDIRDGNRKVLDTIKQQQEKCCHGSNDTLFEIYPESSDEEFLNPNDAGVLQNLKEFRRKNFFECHSVKSRTDSEKPSVVQDRKHKCIYRFYLNERLFPVPFNTDYHENIRCMECMLPLQNSDDVTANGMVQAKVKLNNKEQDMLLMLPVKKNLIIKEKRKEIKTQKDLDSVYFGIIKLNINGDSLFSRSLPNNSLALKYQKGYKELCQNELYEYACINDDDVIII